MSSTTVILHNDHGVEVIAFHRDGDGRAHLDGVRAFFTSDFHERTVGVQRLVIDLGGVATLDSACLGPLVQKLREIQGTEGRLALTGVEAPALKEIFALTRFDKVFPIYATRDAAIEAVRG